MRIKDLATRATKLLTGSAYMVFDNGTKVEKVDYAELAKQIITEYNTQTLAGSAQSVKSALDALNSNITNQSQNMERLDSHALLTDTISPGYYYVTGATDIPTGVSSNGYLRVYGRKSFLSTLMVIEYRPYNSADTYVNMKKGNESWSGWINLPTRAEMDALTQNTQLTITRTENNYADATSIDRLSARKRGNMLFLNFNLGLASGTTSDFTEICRISGWNSVSDIYTNIPCQTNGASVISVSISPTGIVRIYCGTGTITAGFYRAFFCIPCNS